MVFLWGEQVVDSAGSKSSTEAIDLSGKVGCSA